MTIHTLFQPNPFFKKQRICFFFVINTQFRKYSKDICTVSLRVLYVCKQVQVNEQCYNVWANLKRFSNGGNCATGEIISWFSPFFPGNIWNKQVQKGVPLPRTISWILSSIICEDDFTINLFFLRKCIWGCGAKTMIIHYIWPPSPSKNMMTSYMIQEPRVGPFIIIARYFLMMAMQWLLYLDTDRYF